MILRKLHLAENQELIIRLFTTILASVRRDKHVTIRVPKRSLEINSLIHALLQNSLCDFASRHICCAPTSGDPDFGFCIVKQVGQFFSGRRSMSGTGYLRPRMCEV